MIEDSIERAKRWIEEETERKQLKADADHKQEVIEGLTEDITLAEKRARINQIVRYGHTNYRERFNTLYSEFEKKYHKDIKKRMKNAIDKKKVRKSISKLEYVCEVMNMTNELYELTCKIFENDVDKVVSEFKNGIN